MRIYDIKVNGKKYRVEVASIKEVTPTIVESSNVPVVKKEEASATTSNVQTPVTNGNEVAIVAPMQGTILEVKVQVGQQVKSGDTVAILEAMKLENEIKAPSAGKVLAVKVNKGQNVNSKDVLVVIG